eukprot:5723741-Prymnesium_polylepis.1
MRPVEAVAAAGIQRRRTSGVSTTEFLMLMRTPCTSFSFLSDSFCESARPIFFRLPMMTSTRGHEPDWSSLVTKSNIVSTEVPIASDAAAARSRWRSKVPALARRAVSAA